MTSTNIDKNSELFDHVFPLFDALVVCYFLHDFDFFKSASNHLENCVGGDFENDLDDDPG